MSNKIYDTVIVGGGPAGSTAAVYAARKKLKSAIVTDAWGGQSTVSDDIQNWIGFPHIKGSELAKRLQEHVQEYADNVLDIIFPDRVVSIEKKDGGFLVKTEKGEELQTKTLLYTAGSLRRKLPAKGADEFEHKGLTYCASCDGPLFAGKDVIVVGGGNAGFESAAQLLAYANSVTLFEFGDKFAADPITVDKLMQNPKFSAKTSVEITEVLGDVFVTGIKYRDRNTGEEKEMKTDGIFVEIGMVPNTDLVKDLVKLNKWGKIEIDPWTQKTSLEGVWAAGDCTNILYHQNNIASGDAVVAMEDIYVYLNTK